MSIFQIFTRVRDLEEPSHCVTFYAGQRQKCMDSNMFIKILTLLPDNVFRVYVSFFLVFLGAGCKRTHLKNYGVETYSLVSYNKAKKMNNLYPVGTKATFRCWGNIKLIGPRKSTCQESGSWDPEPGRCDFSRKFCY